MRGIFGITGTPGTGKKSVAPIVAGSLGVRCLGLNELAMAAGLLKGEEGGVDTGLLKKHIAAHLRGPAVVYGHLLPYSIGRGRVAKVAVLRCEPTILKRRLESRGYQEAKVLDNVQAELIGLVSADAYRAFGRAKVFEVDTTRLSAEGAAAETLSLAEGMGKRAGRIDWLPGYDSGAKLRSLLPSV